MARRENTYPNDLLPDLKTYDSVLATQFDAAGTLFTRGREAPVAECRARIAQALAKWSAIEAIEIKRRQLLKERTDYVPVAVGLRDEMKAALTNALGKGHPALDVKGLRPHGGPRKLTVEEEVKRHAKKQGTMKLRGYLTKEEKKQRTFRGTVNVTVTKKPK